MIIIENENQIETIDFSYNSFISISEENSEYACSFMCTNTQIKGDLICAIKDRLKKKGYMYSFISNEKLIEGVWFFFSS